jgi:DNA polymerase III epsilon subunit-like protein
MPAVLIDTETTGLVKPEGTELSLQPHIIEIGALKINDDFEVIGQMDLLLCPPVPLPEIITKITGITQAQLEGKPAFSSIYKQLVDLFFGCHTFIAHNAAFDAALLRFELERIEKLTKFPWPPIHYCTVEQSIWVKGHRLKLSELYKIATGEDEIRGAHRAINDTRAMLECYKWLKKNSPLLYSKNQVK